MDQLSKQRVRLSRRSLLLAGGGALTGLVASRERTSGTPAKPVLTKGRTQSADRTELAFALATDDLPKLQPLLERYTAVTGTRIRAEAFPSATLFTNLSIALLQGTGAYDVVSIDDQWFPALAGGTSFLDLTKTSDDAGTHIDSDFIPALLAIGSAPPAQGVRALPWSADVQVFVWRKDILGSLGLRVPTSWHDALSIGEAIRDAFGPSGMHGFCLSAASGVPAARSFLPVLRGYGSDVLDPVTSEPMLGSAEGFAALTLQRQLAELNPDGAERLGPVEIGNIISAGVAAVTADIWHEQLSMLFDPARSPAAGLLGVGLPPSESGVQPSAVASARLLGIPHGGRNVERALDFVLWMTRARRQKELFLTANVLPTRVSVFTDEECVAKAAYLPSIVNAARSARPRPRTPYYPEIEEILGRHVASTLADAIAPDLAMLLASAEIRSLLVTQGVLE